MSETAIIFVGIVAIGFVALWGNMTRHFFQIYKHRNPDVPPSIWLIYEPQKLSAEGVRSLWRYWLYGIATVAWGSVGVILWAALFS